MIFHSCFCLLNLANFLSSIFLKTNLHIPSFLYTLIIHICIYRICTYLHILNSPFIIFQFSIIFRILFNFFCMYVFVYVCFCTRQYRKKKEKNFQQKITFRIFIIVYHQHSVVCVWKCAVVAWWWANIYIV